MSMRSKTSLSTQYLTPDVWLQQIVCGILVLLELMLPFVHGIFFVGLIPAAVPQVAMQRSNMSLVRP